MLTIRAEIKRREQRRDGTYNVKIRFTLNRKIKRVSTSIFVPSTEINKQGRIKRTSSVYKDVEELVAHYKKKCNEMQVDANNYGIDEVLSLLQVLKIKEEGIDFIKFAREWIEYSPIKGIRNYRATLNSFTTFLKKDTLKVEELNYTLLYSYLNYLKEKNRLKSDELRKKKRESLQTGWCLFTWDV